MSYRKNEIIDLLNEKSPEKIEQLIKKAYSIKEKTVGKKVFFRGLIEFTNICSKNCYYCGIRLGNNSVHRYEMTDDEIIEAALFAYESHYGSIVIQSGERKDRNFIDKLNRVLKQIKEKTEGKLGITLSVGEQSEDVYREFFNSGAHRFLLRIETSSNDLYKKLHPEDHSYQERLKCLDTLKKVGFQVGTGVMIGLPFQTIEDLADDLLFFTEKDIDMVGMGPYLEHPDTPLYKEKDFLWSVQERFDLSIKMIALLRILMPDINIASTTALQTIDPIGREKGLLAGANVIMPNITPQKYRKDYLLYNGKPCLDENAQMCKGCLEARIFGVGEEIAFGEWGDPLHFKNRNQQKK